MGAAAPIAAVALAVGGTLYSSFSQASQLDHAAKVAKENARLSELQGAYDETQIRHDERQSAGNALAAMGSNGIQLNTGSALDTLWQSAYQRELAISNARYDSSQRAQGYRDEAHQLKKQATATRIGGVIRAGSAALSGIKPSDPGATPSGSSYSMRLPDPYGTPGINPNAPAISRPWNDAWWARGN